MNWLDSAYLSAAFQQVGYEVVEDESVADIVCINTCTVTAQADKKSLQEARKLIKSQKKIIAFGCGVSVYFEKWKKQVPQLFLFREKQEVLDHFGIRRDEIDLPMLSRTRLPVAIQTGCDNACTFCVTRFARGKHRNIPVKTILKNIEKAEKAGVQEIVITGINLAAWGCENSNDHRQSRLGELLQNIIDHSSIPRIRLSSLGPQFLNDAFFSVYKNSRICDHLHLSLQSGSSEVLQMMNRGYGEKEIYVLAEKAKQVRPNTAITADVIVGFPGETEQFFRKTMTMVQDIGCAKLHVFPFSSREGTVAAEFSDQISQEVKKDRSKRLQTVGMNLRQSFLSSFEGRFFPVLVEQDGTGLTTNFIRVMVPSEKVNTMVDVCLAKDRFL